MKNNQFKGDKIEKEAAKKKKEMEMIQEAAAKRRMEIEKKEMAAIKKENDAEKSRIASEKLQLNWIKWNVTQGANNWDLDVSTLPAGAYTLYVQSPNQLSSRLFIKAN